MGRSGSVEIHLPLRDDDNVWVPTDEERKDWQAMFDQAREQNLVQQVVVDQECFAVMYLGRLVDARIDP